MHSSSFLAAVTTVVGALSLASPTVVDIRSPNADKMRVQWILDSTLNMVSLDIFTTDSQFKLINNPVCQAYTEGQPITFNSGAFVDTPLIMDISATATGEISYAGKKYIANSVPEHNGGIYCTSVYNDDSAILDCEIPWASAKVPIQYPVDSSAACFPIGSPGADIGSSFSGMQFQRRSNEDQNVPPNTSACQPRSTTVLVGNGNPKDAHLQIQLSSVISCGDGDCDVGYEESNEYTIGWSVSGALPGGWISGGFGVTRSISTGRSYTCRAGPHESVCVWKKIDHVAYKVQYAHDDDCTGWKRDGPVILKSPKTNGGSFYCVRGTCRTQGERYWDPNDVSP